MEPTKGMEEKQNGMSVNLKEGQDNMAPTTRRVSQRNQLRNEQKVRISSRKEMSNDTGHIVEKVKKSSRRVSTSRHQSKDSNIISPEQDIIAESRDTLLSHDEEIGNFQCGNCSKIFESVNLLSFHVGNCAKDIFQCNVCHEVFSCADSLSLHIEEHNDLLKPFKCGICNAGFLENAALIDHLTNSHEKLSSLYRCHLCLILFEEMSKFIAHTVERHPPADKEYKCRLCGKCFSQGNRLSIHMQSHTKESPKLSKCSICSSMLPSTMMNKHILDHEKEKTYKTEKNICKTKRGRKKTVSTPSKSSNENSFENGDNEVELEGVESEFTLAENEATNVENEDKKYSSVKRACKEKKKVLVKQSPTEKKPNLVIKDKNKLIKIYMKIDPQTQSEVFDCDVCGERLQERMSFIQHRDDHFFDNKFCIHCQHCSQIFDTFEQLYAHVGRDKCQGYSCQICEKSFALEPLLLTHHIKEHYDMTKTDQVLTCGVCEKIFENRTAFLRHASSHSEDKCIECKLCRHAFTTPETLFGHLRTIHSLIPLTRQQYKFKCHNCDTNFMKNEALVKHMAIVHNVQGNVIKSNAQIEASKPSPTKVKIKNETLKRTGHWRSAEDDRKRRTCPICNRLFRRFKDVRRHIGSHTKPFLCSHCGKAFPYRYSLDAHIKAFHSAENPHKCEMCNKFFSCQRSLIVHQRIHTGEKPHVCNICQKRFRQVANLSMHMKLHNAEKPIKCELCDYRCRHQGYLKRHMSTHSTEKKHFCPICNKGFTEKPNLNHHLKRHSKIKNHVCPVCGHRFAERYYLNNHMRIHTKEKPYVCPVCSRAFTMRPNMVSHIKKTHPSYNYQPIKRSHNQAENTASIINNSSDVNLLVPAQNYPSSVTTIPPSMSFSSNIPAPVISSIPHSLLTSSQTPPQTNVPSHLPISTETIPLYHHVTDSPAMVKLPPDNPPMQIPPPRDLLAHPLPPQREIQQVAMREPMIHRDQVGRETIVMEQSIHRDSERHPQYINLTDRFSAPQFIDPREMPNQNFPSVHVHMDYMYSYPNMPPEPFHQGFFLPTNQHNTNTNTHTEPKP